MTDMLDPEGSAVQAVLAIMMFIAAVITIKSIADYIMYLRRKKKNAAKRRTEVRRAIYKKDMIFYLDLGERNASSERKTTILPCSKPEPVRVLKGFFAEQFYSLSEEERRKIL